MIVYQETGGPICLDMMVTSILRMRLSVKHGKQLSLCDCKLAIRNFANVSSPATTDKILVLSKVGLDRSVI